MRFTFAILSSSLVKDLACSSICAISISFFANERVRWYHNPPYRRSPWPSRRTKIPIDYCSQCVLILGMSIDRSALPIGGDRARPRLDGGRLTLSLVRKYLDSAPIWLRKAMAPGGVTGVIMALVFIVATAGFLMLMRRLEELPPVSLTFLIPVVVAAIRWGTLSAAITAIGGAGTMSLFYYNPFYITGPDSRSRFLG